MSTNGNNITSAADWKSKSRSTLDCPSGAVVIIRRVSLVTLLTTGRVPEALVSGYLDGIKALDAIKKVESGVDLSQIQKAQPVIDAVLAAALVKPRVVIGEASEEEINVRDIPDEDRMFLFNHAITGSPSIPVQMSDGSEASVEALTSFRENGKLQGGSRDGEGVRAEAVTTNGD